MEEYNWWATNEPGQLVRIENTNQVPNKFIMMDVTNKGKTVKAGFMKDSNREDIPNVELLPVRDAVFVGDVDNLNARTTGGLATVNYVQDISEESIINVTIDGYTITYALGEGNITGSDVISVEGTNVGSNGTITIQFIGDNGLDCQQLSRCELSASGKLIVDRYIALIEPESHISLQFYLVLAAQSLDIGL